MEGIVDGVQILAGAGDSGGAGADKDRGCDSNMINTIGRALITIEMQEMDCEHIAAKDKNVPTNDGWIPVEERLPTMEEYQKDDGRFILDDGNRRYQGLFDIYDGKFKFSKHISGIRYELLEDKCVIAWRPMPDPYRPKERGE